MVCQLPRVIALLVKIKNDSNFIKNTLSTSLKIDFTNGTRFSPRNLAKMRKFYETNHDFSILPITLAKLPWPFNCLLLDKVEDIVKRIWYAKECLNNELII